MIESYYKENYQKCIKRIYSRTKDVMAAEDVVQDAFERALKYYHTYDSSHEFEAWFNTILNNSYKDWIKDNRNQGMVVEYDEEKDDPLPMADLKTESVVQREMTKLCSNQRHAAHLYFNAGLMPREISQIVDMTPRTVAKSISQFKRHIREMLS